MLQCRCAWRCFASHSEQLAHISGMTHCGARLPCPLVLALALASLTAGCFLTLSLLAHLLLLRVSFALLTATSTHPVSYTSALSHSAHTAHTPHMTHTAYISSEGHIPLACVYTGASRVQPAATTPVYFRRFDTTPMHIAALVSRTASHTLDIAHRFANSSIDTLCFLEQIVHD